MEKQEALGRKTEGFLVELRGQGIGAESNLTAANREGISPWIWN
jgi:hypothetical protein